MDHPVRFQALDRKRPDPRRLPAIAVTLEVEVEVKNATVECALEAALV